MIVDPIEERSVLNNYRVYVAVVGDNGNIIVQTQLQLSDDNYEPIGDFIFDTAYKFMQIIVHETAGMAIEKVEAYHD